MDAPLRIGLSRCLTGDAVRHDGSAAPVPALLAWLAARAELLPVCPEVEIGMGTPREPLVLQVSASGVPSLAHRVRLVGTTSGTTWTSRMAEWSDRQARKWAEAGVSGVVLLAGSPACGLRGVPVESGRLTLSGRGLFAEALARVMPGVPLLEVGELEPLLAREAFLAAVRAARLR